MHSRPNGSPVRPLLPHGSPSRLQPPVARPHVILYSTVLLLCATIILYHVMMLPVWGASPSQLPGDVLAARRAGAPGHKSAHKAGPAWRHAHQPPVHDMSCRQLKRMATPHTWKHIPIGENGKLRFEMWVYNSSDIVSTSLDGGTWEAWEIAEVHWALKRPQLPPVNASGQPSGQPSSQPAVFVDVGANVGWYTLVMALRNHTVLAFEGMRENAQMVARSLCGAPALARRTTLQHLGLGAAPSRCYIYSHSTNLGDGHTLCTDETPETAATHLPPGYKIRDTMQISRLDDVILSRYPPSKPLPPLVLKIDVEGFEFEVLKGAVQLLARGAFQYILAERDPGMMASVSGPNAPRDFLFFVMGFGYSVSDKSFEGPFVPPERMLEVADKWGSKQRNLYLVHKNAPTAQRLRFYKQDQI